MEKGFSFIPTPQPTNACNKEKFADVTNYHRRLKIATYFGPSEDDARIPFMPPSDWEPPWSKVPELIKTVISLDKEYLRRRHFSPYIPNPNLTPEETEALYQLTKEESIVMKPADKGSAIVIMDRTHYVNEALRQLDNPEFYQQLPKPIYPDTVPIIHNIIHDLLLQGFLNKKQTKYLLGDKEPKQRHFYLLPKIHKPRTSWPSPFMAPGRPIVSDCGSESYRIAEYIDFYLTPLSILHQSYVKDTYSFITKIQQIKLGLNHFLFTIDIDSLYTNIETDLGLAAIKNIFKKHPQTDRPDGALLRLLTLSLQRNDFEFDGKVYLQIKGTAMGKKFAPAYANIYMADWEDTVLPKCPKRPPHYFRYLDDIWGTWPYSEEEFKTFIGILNGHHRSIKVKYFLDLHSVDFLDTTTFKGPNFNVSKTLDVKVFFKETDTHALLHKTSYHPQHTFSGIVKSQILRFHRICTRQEDFEAAKKTLFQALRNRGYSRTFLRHIDKQWQRDQSKKDLPLITETDKHIIPLVLPFSETAKELAHQIKKNFTDTCQETHFKEEWEVMPAYRRNKNLKDLLVRSKLPQLNKRNKKVIGHHLIKNHSTGDTYRRPANPLNTNNNIYLITCRKCQKQYVGQTKNSVKTRMQAHRHNILHGLKKDTYLVSHFQRHGITNMFTTSLEQNPNWTLEERLSKERIWIRKLNTIYPYGLNEKHA